MIKEFENITFDEQTHKYFINGKQAGISTTGLIAQYSNEFNAEEKAPQTCKKCLRLRQQIKDGKKIYSQDLECYEKYEEYILSDIKLTEQFFIKLWEYNCSYACIKGTLIHEYAQSLWSKRCYSINLDEVDDKLDKEQLRKDLYILQKQAVAFYEEFKDMYIFIKDEQYLYDEEWDTAGSIDLLLQNIYTLDYVIVDFKSNDNFYKKAYGKMKVPLQKFDDDNIHHYSLQLEVYKQIFEKNTSLKVESTFIVWFDTHKDNFEIIEPINVKKETKLILEFQGLE